MWHMWLFGQPFGVTVDRFILSRERCCQKVVSLRKYSPRIGRTDFNCWSTLPVRNLLNMLSLSCYSSIALTPLQMDVLRRLSGNPNAQMLRGWVLRYKTLLLFLHLGWIRTKWTNLSLLNLEDLHVYYKKIQAIYIYIKLSYYKCQDSFSEASFDSLSLG